MSDVYGSSCSVSDISPKVDLKLDEIYTKYVDGIDLSNLRLLGEVPSIYSSLDFLDREGYIVYDKPFDNVSITVKGKIKAQSGGFRIEHDVKIANDYVQLNAPKQIKKANNRSTIALILSAVAILVQIILIVIKLRNI